MNKRIFVVIGFVSLFIVFIACQNNKNSRLEVTYNGNNLLINIDGKVSDKLPSEGDYYLTGYDCEDDVTKVTWDKNSYELTVSNGKNSGSVSCNLEFDSSPKLSDMPVGSYVKYIGRGGNVGNTNVSCKINGVLSSSDSSEETESSNSCLGQNAREDIDRSGYTYGFCDSGAYYTTGWRLAYVDANKKPVIISAGSPECVTGDNYEENNAQYIRRANTRALKYCNVDYVDGECNCPDADGDGECDSPSTDVWAINETDFYYMTKQSTNTVGGYIYNSIADAVVCGGRNSRIECGYNNDLIDIGSNYWFAAVYPSSTTYRVYWDTTYRNPKYTYDNTPSGLRPVISLKSALIVIGGNGTMDDPYIIADNSFIINDGANYINSYSDKSNVVLNLIALDEVTSMCISVDNSECTDYIEIADTYTLDWSNEDDGEKIVYVYYKNSSNEIVASLSQTIILDTVGPTNSDVTFNESDGMERRLNISSTGADYMCFSNTSNDVSQCTDWINYSTSYIWLLEPGVGDRTVYAFFKDEVNNIDGPYAISTTCTNGCDYKYFVDTYTTDYVFLMRGDGATTRVSVNDSSITWYGEGSVNMKRCDALSSSTTGQFWCIGYDNNVYYKTSYTESSWYMINTSKDIDISNYDYFIHPYTGFYSSEELAYIIRSDGKISTIRSGGISDTSWSYGYNREMAVCNGSDGNIIACLGKNGYYYYSTDYTSTSDYLGGTISNLTDRNSSNSWVDLYLRENVVHIIESDGTSVYNAILDFKTSSTSTTWYKTSSPGGGVVSCAGTGYLIYNCCLSTDGYLYYKVGVDTEWIKTLVFYK